MIYCSIGLGAFFIRLLYLSEINAADVTNVLLGDARSYHTWAQAIAAGNWIGNEVFFQAPFYPYFLAVAYSIFGESSLAVRVIQMILGSISCVLLTRAGQDFFGRRTGILSGLILAVYPPAIFFDGIIQKASMTAFLLILSICCLGRFMRRPKTYLAFLSGCILGCLALVRENALILVPIAFGWVVWLLRYKSPKVRWISSTTLVLGLLVVLLPVAIRNQLVGGEFHLTTSQFGYNFYLGNNAETDGTFKPLRVGKADVRYEREDARNIAEAAVGSALTPAEVSRYWTHEALDYIRSDPLDWLKLTARKVALTFNAVEIGDTEDLYTYAESSRLIRWSSAFIHMGLLCPLAVIGFLVSWKERRKLLFLYLSFSVYAASVVVFVIYGRYRFPLVPFLILFAAEALARCGRAQFEPGNRRRLVAALAVGVAVAVGTNWPMLVKDSYRISTHSNIANALIEAGQYERALPHLTTALEMAPTYHNAHYLMGVMYSRLGQPQEAERHYRQAIEYEPDCALQHTALGALLTSQGRFEEALGHLETSLRLDPTSAETYGTLSIALAQTGRLDDALSVIEDGLRVDGQSALLQYNYGIMLRHAGRLTESRAVFQKILRSDPSHINARHNLVTIDLELGRPRAAIEELDAILDLDPQDIGTKVRLAWLLASHEREDIRDGPRALRLALEINQAAGGPDPHLLDLLAAAYAENGDFDRAVRLAAQAAQLATERGDASMAGDIEQKRRLYAQGRPYRNRAKPVGQVPTPVDGAP